MTEESSTNGSEQFRKFVDDFLSTAAPALEDVVNSKADMVRCWARRSETLLPEPHE